MTRYLDLLASPTLKYLRGEWWSTAFSDFLRDTLRPRPGNRILDVGCGDGTAELALGRLHISQLDLVAIDRDPSRVRQAAAAGLAHNLRLGLAAADVGHLPFADATFDAAFCVAVLQHVGDLQGGVRELARVTRPGGRVVAVEPDNGARYWFSSSSLGQQAFEAAERFFTAAARRRGEPTDCAVGPRLSTLFGHCGIELEAVQLFPISVTHIGEVPASLWEARRRSVQKVLDLGGDETVIALADEYLAALDRYQREAVSEGRALVEIQHMMLFASVGMRTDDPVAEMALAGSHASGTV
jgi:SAM-dependent methyltransferase